MDYATRGFLKEYCYILTLFLNSPKATNLSDITSLDHIHAPWPLFQFSLAGNLRNTESEGTWQTPEANVASRNSPCQVSFGPNGIVSNVYEHDSTQERIPNQYSVHPSASTIPSPQSSELTPSTQTESSNSSIDTQVSKRRCPHCSRVFSSSSNLGKHKRTDCKKGSKKERFLCRNVGCDKTMSREAYRIVHERDKCLFR